MVIVLMASGLLAGCGLGAQSAPQALGTRGGVHQLEHSVSHPSTSVPDLPLARVTIFLEGSNERLTRVHREVSSPATLQEIMDQLVAGPVAPSRTGAWSARRPRWAHFLSGNCETGWSPWTCPCRSRT